MYEIFNYSKLIGNTVKFFFLSDMESVLSTTMLYNMVATCDRELLPYFLDQHGDLKWLENVESHISSILIKENPTIEEKKDLQVILENIHPFF